MNWNGSRRSPTAGFAHRVPGFATIRVGASCFADYVDNDQFNWLNAENMCVAHGGHLASIASSLEQAAIVELQPQAQPWIGIDDRAHHGTFVWSDGSAVSYTHWGPGNPHTDQSQGDCGYIDVATLTWMTVDCTDQAPEAICKLRGCNNDGIVDAGEICDDGNLDDTDACTSWCVPASCGDGVVHAGFEECDDGNGNDTDACTNACRNNTCGNGVIEPGEQCDCGRNAGTKPAACGSNNADTGACTTRCTVAYCGDGVVEAGVEQCDDGNGVNTDGCVGCRLARCGDGEVQIGVEQCDDGNNNPYDGCERCFLATCGNGIKEAGEACDDGNRVDGDGCSADCSSACGNGVIDPGESCDDGNNLPNDGCPADCKPGCGDGIVQAGEQCDDANAIDTDFCLSSCQFPCGFAGEDDYSNVAALIAGQNGACYAVMVGTATFDDAISACMQGSLGEATFVLPDQGGDLSVAAQIAAVYGPLWLGVEEVSPGQYQWQNGATPDTTSWGTSQPDDASGAATCVLIDASGRWSDDSCNDALPFVCSILGS